MKISNLVREYWQDIAALFVLQEGRRVSVDESFALIRRLIIRRCAPVLGVIGIVMVAHAHLAGFYTGPAALLVTLAASVLLLTAPLLCRAGVSHNVMGLVLTLAVGIGLFVDGWSWGGISSPDVAILCIVPVLAAFFSGPRTALVAGLFVSLLLVALLFAPGVPITQGPPNAALVANAIEASQQRALAYALIAVWVLLILISSFYYLISQITRGAFFERDRAGKEVATINDFLSSLSHDLRTPLNAILGLSKLMRDGRINDASTIQESSDLIHDSGLVMLEMLNDLLLFAKMDSKQIELEIGQCDLAEIVKAQVRMLSIKAAERDQTIEIESEGLPQSFACDVAKMGRLVGNLVSNALKYSPPETVIRVSLTQGDGNVRLVVADQGVGMTPEDIDVALQPFGQVKTSSHGRAYEKGVGLGLNICKEIVDLHGGTFFIESEKGKGTRVIVTLPLKQPMKLAS